jgi:hypothetical protein
VHHAVVILLVLAISRGAILDWWQPSTVLVDVDVVLEVDVDVVLELEVEVLVDVDVDVVVVDTHCSKSFVGHSS